jgi:hypothetical protein
LVVLVLAMASVFAMVAILMFKFGFRFSRDNSCRYVPRRRHEVRVIEALTLDATDPLFRVVGVRVGAVDIADGPNAASQAGEELLFPALDFSVTLLAVMAARAKTGDTA